MADPLQQSTEPRWPVWVLLCRWLWDRRKFVWGALIVALIVGVTVNWLTSTSVFTGTPLGAILLWIHDHLLLAGFIGVCFLFLTVLVGLVSHLTDISLPRGSISSQQRNRSAIIQLLRNEYRRQKSVSLQGATVMTLPLQPRTDLIPSSVSLVSWREDMSGASLPAPSSIVQAYDDAGGRLLLVGEAGAGKSQLLRELALELLIRAENDTTQPIPVIINLFSWANKKPPLTVWIVNQIGRTYHISPRLSQTLIKQNQLLFLLDGLDEVKLSARAACVEAINTYLAGQEYIIPLVVCSRSHEYREQEELLKVPLAVEIQRLTFGQVNEYLKEAGRPLAAVRTALRSNTVLSELVRTPLLLSIVMRAYRDKMAKDLPQLGSAEEQQYQVFTRYVTRMLEQQTRKWHYESSKTLEWLIWLAQQMKRHDMTEFYLEYLQPDWLSGTQWSRHRWRFEWISRLSREQPGQIAPVGLLTWSWKEIHFRPLQWLSLFLFYIMISGFLSEQFGPLLGLLLSILYALFFFFVFGLSRKQPSEPLFSSPNEFIWHSGKNGVLGGLAFGLLCLFFILALVFILVKAELVVGLLIALGVGLLPGLHAGLVFGLGAFLQHFLLRLSLWRSGAMPWQYIRFLNEATERALLQHVGVGYSFIHPLFRDYFASLDQTPP